MRKVFVLSCIFSLFLALSCSKKSESNETYEEKGVTSEELNNISDENKYNASDNDESEGSGLEGFVFDDETDSSKAIDDSHEETDDVKSNIAPSGKKVPSAEKNASKAGSVNNREDSNTDESEAYMSEEAEPVVEPEIEKPKDLVPPGPITDLTGYYNGAKNQVIISWTEPADDDFAYVQITSNGSNEGTSRKGSNTFGVRADSIGKYDISVVSYDTSGNAGPATDFSIETKFFESASMPTLAGTAGKGRPIRIVAKGTGFTTKGISSTDFTVTCAEDSSVARKANVRIVDDNTAYADVAIPKRAGKYNVTMKCGNNRVVGSFSVIDSAPIGTIEKAGNGTPVAVLAGYNSLGLPFGIALDEQKGLKWATSFGYSEKFEDIMCIVPQVELGAGSALSAEISGDLDGEDNWAAIVAEDNSASSSSYSKEAYPLFHYASNYGNSMPAGYKDGWFIPSLYELCQVYANKAKLNEVMSLIDKAKPLGDDFYWSSSQCDEENDKACAVRFSTGSIFKYKRKSDSVYGRCVRMMY